MSLRLRRVGTLRYRLQFTRALVLASCTSRLCRHAAQVLALPEHERDLTRGNLLGSLLMGARDHRFITPHVTLRPSHFLLIILERHTDPSVVVVIFPNSPGCSAGIEVGAVVPERLAVGSRGSADGCSYVLVGAMAYSRTSKWSCFYRCHIDNVWSSVITIAPPIVTEICIRIVILYTIYIQIWLFMMRLGTHSSTAPPRLVTLLRSHSNGHISVY
jgi:hypothetical protein